MNRIRFWFVVVLELISVSLKQIDVGWRAWKQIQAPNTPANIDERYILKYPLLSDYVEVFFFLYWIKYVL